MKHCTGKTGLITVCVIQLLATVEREVFDFLGYMWLPLLANFLQLVAVIFGLFGAFQHRLKYLIVYATWAFVWLGWNGFMICFYLEVGGLRRTDEFLSLYTGSASFWEASGPGCVPVYTTNASLPSDPFRQPRPARVDGCWMDYPQVEVLHAGIQILLTLVGLVLALCLIAARRREDDSSGVKPRSLSPAFHIEYRPHRVEERMPSPEPLEEPAGAVGGAVGPVPMTPRKIKRRAMTRNSQRSSGRSRGSGRNSSRQRSSQRQRRHINPVTQLLDSSSGDLPADPLPGLSNPGFQDSELTLAPPRPPSVHSSYSNYHGQRRPVPAVASDYGTTGTLSGYSGDRLPDGRGRGAGDRRPAGQVPSARGAERAGTGNLYGELNIGRGNVYSEYGRSGPPPYEAVPSLTETSM